MGVIYSFYDNVHFISGLFNKTNEIMPSTRFEIQNLTCFRYILEIAFEEMYIKKYLNCSLAVAKRFRVQWKKLGI